MTPITELRIGTAGWSIPRAAAARFDVAGTHLQRYARRLRCAEINSSFHRPHALATYRKWRDATPPDFLFSVKMPRAITHERQLHDAGEPLAAFLAQSDGLVPKRGPILIQLPPSLAFEATVATTFLTLLRGLDDGPVVLEPRHPTWFSDPVNALLDAYRVARVAADPAPAPAGALPAGWPGLAYFRLHGSPRKYWSKYDEPYLATLATIAHSFPAATDVWCVFDNTASGAAVENACELVDRVSGRAPGQ